MNVFIIFIKFLSWIAAISIKLVRLTKEKDGLGFWKGAHLKKLKYIITKKQLDLGGPSSLGLPPRSIPVNGCHKAQLTRPLNRWNRWWYKCLTFQVIWSASDYRKVYGPLHIFFS